MMGEKKSIGSLTVGIIGLGYVGLPLALEFARSHCRVLGLDIDPDKVQQLQSGHCYLKHVDSSDLKTLIESGLLAPSIDFSRLSEVEAILICVPTPLSEERQPDLRYVVETARTVSRTLRKGQLVVLESTTFPGTTEEVLQPLLEESGLRCSTRERDPDFYLAFSPERIDPGNKQFRLRDIPKIVGGINSVSAEQAKKLYERVFDKVILVSSSRVAEMTKLLENTYRAVNIALVNELKLICQRMGIDIWEVIEAAGTKPFGFTAFYPGPGLGGHCMPIDPFYLAWKARKYDVTARFIELAGEINTAMPYHVVQTIGDALNERSKAVRGARILILGVAYKKDIDDIRESPALKIMKLLIDRGAEVSYNDPHVPRLFRTRRYDFSQMSSVPLARESLSTFDCVVVVTDHSSYDFHEIAEHAQLIIDTRNATRGIECSVAKVVRC